MASKRTREVSSSSSSPALKKIRGASSFTPRWNYDVFLNFRGEDTRKNFIEHLYTTLDQKGIRIFRDDNELRKGEDIESELLTAIEQSRIAIIVFSRNYASSRWCLDELVKIIQCKKMIGQTVMPVFYDVDPSDVQEQNGSFAEAFAKHEERLKEDIEKVEKWRTALTEAANLSGWDLQNVANGSESKFIQRIVEEVYTKLSHTPLNVAVYEVGIDSRIQDINVLLNVGSDDVRIVGIHGMGGIGKTTIAKAVYNLICHKFDGSSFLANIGEISNQHNGLVCLQEQLLSDVRLKRKLAIRNIDRGITVIKESLYGKSVLIVLDDVDHLDQLYALAGKRDWFGLGSRIIITTRDEHLLNNLEVDVKYKAKKLNRDESLHLFSWHAFKQDHPVEDYLELSNSVTTYAGGLPLALKVLGSYLFKRSVLEWRSALEKLRRIPDGYIQDKLRISYDALNPIEKVTFLDIACFLIGTDKDYAIKILDACGYYTDIGISVLIQRSLVTISGDKLAMHDLLRDMGREIVRQQSPKEPAQRSRLWFHEDVCDVLTKNTGTKAIEGLTVNLSTLKGVNMSGEAFAKMENLRLLQVNCVQLTRGYERVFKDPFPFLGEKHLFKELRWLCWHGFNLKCIPNSFHLGNLVILDMQHSSIKEVWKGFKSLGKLKVLNLSHCHCLTRTPNFLGLPSLEILILEGCTSLVEVHESIGHLERLVLLNMKDCKNLHNLPCSICELKSLEDLIFCGCSKLDKLPEDLGNMECLRKLSVDKTAIKQLPQSIVHLRNLENLSLSGSKGSPSKSVISFLWSMGSMRKTPDSITPVMASFSGLCSLKRLILRDCNLLAIPNDVWSLSSLEELELCNNNFCSLPSSIGCLSRLWSLNLTNCTKLETLPKLPSRMNLLYADDCTSLKRLPSLSNIENLYGLTLQNCSKLIEIQGLEVFELISAIQMKRFLQGMSGGGAYGIILPMSEIPEWFEYQSTESSMSFMLRPRMGYEIQGLIICSVYAATKESINTRLHRELGISSTIQIQGKPSSCWGLNFDSVSHHDNIWVKYQQLSPFDLFEGGKQVDVIIETKGKFQVKKCGVHVVYVSSKNASTVKLLGNALEC